jgi:hypothetical protein
MRLRDAALIAAVLGLSVAALAKGPRRDGNATGNGNSAEPAERLQSRRLQGGGQTLL